MEEYITRLMAIGYQAPNAWNIVVSFLKERDYDGLEAYVARQECRKRGVA